MHWSGYQCLLIFIFILILDNRRFEDILGLVSDHLPFSVVLGKERKASLLDTKPSAAPLCIYTHKPQLIRLSVLEHAGMPMIINFILYFIANH